MPDYTLADGTIIRSQKIANVRLTCEWIPTPESEKVGLTGWSKDRPEIFLNLVMDDDKKYRLQGEEAQRAKNALSISGFFPESPTGQQDTRSR
jgi:hypothetical protein